MNNNTTDTKIAFYSIFTQMITLLIMKKRPNINKLVLNLYCIDFFVRNI